MDIELRSAENIPSSMPEAFLRVEPYGVYYCSNGVLGWEYLGRVTAKLVGEFGAVTVVEL